MQPSVRFQHNYWRHHNYSHLLFRVLLPVRHAGTALEITIATPDSLFAANILLDAEAPANQFRQPHP